MAKIFIPAEGECEILDDLDFVAPAQTVRFSLEGIYYEVDLSASNLAKLRGCLKPYIKASHVVKREHAMP